MESTAPQIRSRRALTLELPPSCLEFSPLLPSYFLVGTYDLQKTGDEFENTEPAQGPQKRNGSIVVYELAGQDIAHIHTEPRPSAILDLRFQTYSGKQDVLGVVSSTGTLEVFGFSSSSLSERPRLTLLGMFRVRGLEEDVLFLQFSWHPTMPDTVAITTSQGGVHILQLGSDYTASRATQEPVMLHSLEAWCVAISPTIASAEHSDGRPFTIYSGGDDSVLQYATCTVHGKLSVDGDTLDVELPYSAQCIRGHGAGVTAILPLPRGKDIVVTGSYDDHIRVYSIQPLAETFGLRKTKLLAEANLGGGVWRLRLIKHKCSDSGGAPGTWTAHVLASCMHAGARIVRIQGSNDGSGDVEVEVLGRFEEHKSMNYASDFQPGSEADSDGGLICVSTSFYDKLLCLWSIKLGF